MHRLLLVAQEGKVRVEEVVRRVALPGGGKTNDVDEHVREGVAGHGAVGAALHLEIEEEAAVATQDRERPQAAFGLEAAQRRDLFESRPILVLQHGATRIVADDAANHAPES